MDRRSFFSSLITPAAGAAAIALPAPAGQTPGTAEGSIPNCICGWQFVVRHALTDEGVEVGRYMECMHVGCVQFGRPFRIPTVPLEDADPRLVAIGERTKEREREAMEAGWSKTLGRWP